MGKIRVLSEVVASQVAAGEVVERPASVVKELLDNCMDAGARQIEIEVRGAGTGLLRVTDDGVGMDREDALMAIERHATSKISTAADLVEVRTMGFRGEALPSMASVAEFTLRTRTAEAAVGTEVVIHGGRLSAVRDAGCAAGTTVEIKSLFFNVPARRKFLRSAATETAHLDRVVETAALAFPEMAIHYVRDGRTVYRLPSAKSVGPRIADIFGVEARRELLEIVPREIGGVTVWGLVSRPGITRADRQRQFFFVNNRAVENGFLAAGVREAYRQMLEPGRHPSVFLFLSMDRQGVDCNVHPAKREVRFRHGAGVREAVRTAIEDALREARSEWMRPLQRHVAAQLTPRMEPTTPHLPRASHQPEFVPQPPEARPAQLVSAHPTEPTSEAETARTQPMEEFRLIGALSKRYLLLEGAEGLVMLDQRGARQRILFERLQRGVEGQAVASQHLLLPAVFELPSREYELVKEKLSVLMSSGFAVEAFGGHALKVEALPDFLAGRDPQRVLEDFAAECLANGGMRGVTDDDAVRRAVTRLVREDAGETDERGQRALVAQLLACDLPYCDPEGAPVMLQFSWRELERKFGRSP